jgi:hypothetical protein
MEMSNKILDLCESYSKGEISFEELAREVAAALKPLSRPPRPSSDMNPAEYLGETEAWESTAPWDTLDDLPVAKALGYLTREEAAALAEKIIRPKGGKGV